MREVLLLNADYSPLRVLDWQRAIGLMLDDKVGVVATYADRFVRAPSLRVPWPAVVAQRRYTAFRSRVPFNRENVIARDEATCQYCGASPRRPSGRPAVEELTLDHVVPRAQAVDGRVWLPWSGRWVPVTSWENVVAACAPCNRLKGPRTPMEAGLRLRALPVRPAPRDAVRVGGTLAGVPEEWRVWLAS